LTTDFLALVGGHEFKPSNEEHDGLLVEQPRTGSGLRGADVQIGGSACDVRAVRLGKM
jgi:hypothetical protein